MKLQSRSRRAAAGTDCSRSLLTHYPACVIEGASSSSRRCRRHENSTRSQLAGRSCRQVAGQRGRGNRIREELLATAHGKCTAERALNSGSWSLGQLQAQLVIPLATTGNWLTCNGQRATCKLQLAATYNQIKCSCISFLVAVAACQLLHLSANGQELQESTDVLASASACAPTPPPDVSQRRAVERAVRQSV